MGESYELRHGDSASVRAAAWRDGSGEQTKTGVGAAFGDCFGSGIRGACSRARGERAACSGGELAAIRVGALSQYNDRSAAAKKSELAGAGGTAGTASARGAVSGAEAVDLGVAERHAGTFIFLGALVRGL